MTRHTGIRADGTAELKRGVSYWCINHHHTRRVWSTTVEVPGLWECRHCGLPAGQDKAHPPEPVAAQPFKSPFAHVQERRSDAEGEALLAEALNRLRARRRGTGRPGSRGLRS